MSKHHLKNLAEQIANKGYGAAPFHYGKDSQQASQPAEPTEVIEPETEQNLNDAVSKLINEGDPNTQIGEMQ